MSRKIYILNGTSGNMGVVRITENGNNSVLSINLDKSTHEKKICKIKSGDQITEIGSFYKKKTDFNVISTIKFDNIIIEEAGKPIAWTGEISPPEIKQPPNETNADRPMTFDTFLGGGFEWTRVRGNYILYDYSIIHHILSDNNVYRSINKAGYYCVGKCEKDGITFIAIAIPLSMSIKTPFSGFSADIYKIHSKKMTFDALCVGIDKTGEFFISI